MRAWMREYDFSWLRSRERNRWCRLIFLVPRANELSQSYDKGLPPRRERIGRLLQPFLRARSDAQFLLAFGIEFPVEIVDELLTHVAGAVWRASFTSAPDCKRRTRWTHRADHARFRGHEAK